MLRGGVADRGIDGTAPALVGSRGRGWVRGGSELLREFVVEGFKPFIEATGIPCAPLTVITGTNSSGKSTLFQALLLLRHAFSDSSRGTGEVLLNGRGLSLGSYRDISSGGACAPIGLGVKLQSTPRGAPGQGIPRGTALLALGQSVSTSIDFSLTLRVADADAGLARVAGYRFESEKMQGVESVETEMTVRESRADVTDPGDATASFEHELEYRATSHAERGSGTREAVPLRLGGLMPDSVLVEKSERRVFSTLRAAVTLAVRVLGERALELSEIRAEAAGRHKPRFQIVKMRPRDIGRGNRFVDEATDPTFAEHLQALGPVVLLLTQHLHYQPGQISHGGPAAEKLCAAYIDRILALGQRTAAGLETSLSAEAVEQIDALSAVNGPIASVLGAALGTGNHPELEALVAAAFEESGSPVRTQVVEPFSTWSLPASSSTDYGLHRESGIGALQRYFADSMLHLGPLREDPRNLYPTINPESPTDIGAKGERSIAVLRSYGDRTIDAPKPGGAPRQVATTLVEAVHEWARWLGVLDNLDLSANSKFGTQVRVRIVADDEAPPSDLTNVGVGVSQLLPILVLCLAAPVNAAVLIEQPELHLHPAVQTRLATFFYHCVRAGRQVLLETHSEHIVNGLRVLVARGDMDAEEELRIHYIERDEFGSSVVPITVERDGRIPMWPAGFFDESERVLSELVTARLDDG